MIYAVTGLACLLILLFYQRAVLLMPVWTFLTPKALMFLDVDAVPAISVYKVLCVVLIVGFVFREFRNGRLQYNRNPVGLGLWVVVFFSMVSALANAATPNFGLLTLLTILLEIVFPATIFSTAVARLDYAELNRLFRAYVIGLAALSIYGTLAYLVGINPYVIFMESTLHTGRVVIWTYAETLRGARALGTISHPITYGAIILTGLLTYFVVSIERGSLEGRSLLKAGVFTAIIIFAVLLTNSRSPLILLFVAGGVFLVRQGMLRSLAMMAALGIVAAVLFFASDVVQDRILAVVNIINPEIGADQNGSDLNMRSLQLAASFRYFDLSPLWGNGLDASRNIIASGSDPDLFNTESILFKLMIDQGVLGILAYVFLYGYLYFSVSTQLSDRSARALYLGLVVGHAAFALATGMMDTLHHVVFFAIFIFYFASANSRKNAALRAPAGSLQLSALA